MKTSKFRYFVLLLLTFSFSQFVGQETKKVEEEGRKKKEGKKVRKKKK